MPIAAIDEYGTIDEDEFIASLTLITMFVVVPAIFILRRHRWAWIFGTILGNPVYWIINGIYIKNRWGDFMISSSAVKKKSNVFQPYHCVEEEDSTVYEFKTIYLYILYGILAMIAIGYWVDMIAISILGCIFMVLYFLVISTQYAHVNKKIKKAASDNYIKISGSKWSFASPLQIKIIKHISEQV